MAAGTKRKDNKGRVLRTGEQQRRSDGQYLYRYTDLIGKTRTVYAPTLTELRTKERQIAKDLEDGIDFARGEITLNKLFELYLKNKSDLRPTSRERYSQLWKSGIESTELGQMKISRIRKTHIQEFYSSLVKKGAATNTIKNHHRLIRSALDLAAENDWIRKNPAEKAMKGIAGSKKERKPLTREEQAELLKFLNDHPVYSVYLPMISFALATGLRVSELCGLRWSDVDREKGTISVERQLSYNDLGDGCTYSIMEPKSEAGKRMIPLTDTVNRALKEQRRLDQMTGRTFTREKVCGIKDFIFVNTQGRPYNRQTVDSVMKNITRAFNRAPDAPLIMPQLSSHILRHTFCSRMVENGMPPKTLQYIAGHSQISTTLDIYTELDYEVIQRQAKEADQKVG